MSEVESNTSAMSANNFREIESIVSPYICRPEAEQLSFDDSKCYNFVVLDIETSAVNATSAEVCQLSAIDYSGSHSFTEYVLPEGNIDFRATDFHNLTIRSINGVRQLFKNNVVVPALHINEAIKNFEIYISQCVERAKATTDKRVMTVLIGHNIAAFDARILLRNAGRKFADTLQSMDVWFGDSLKLFRALVKCKLPSLENADGTFPKTAQASLYYALFQDGPGYSAHDALADATALRKILFLSRLELSFKTIVDNSRLVSVDHAFRDMQYLDRRSRNSKSFTRIAYDPRTGRGLKEGMIERISGSGLTYRDLKNVYKQYGRAGIVAILSNSPTTSPLNKPRVTKTERILTTVVEHFQISAQSPSSLLASRISGIPSVESPGSFNPPSNLNLGSQESPGKPDLSDKEEQLYVEKLKQLSVYTEPLRKMIAKMQNEEDAANKDSKNLTKLKRLLSILGNPKERVPYQALLKVEDVLRRKLPFEGKSEPVPIGHSFLEALQGQAKTNSSQSNNRLFQMLAPTLGTIHGPPICPPQVPSPRHENHDPESPLPHAVKSEIAQLTSKFTIDYANEGGDSCEQSALVCSINDKTLPAVPDLVVRLPVDYPNSSPHFDTKDYETSDFLKRIKARLKNKLVSLPRMYTFTTLLLNWESAVRYVDARSGKVTNEHVQM